MNYLDLGGFFYNHYLYVDLNTNEDYAADSLFYKRHIPVKYGEEWSRDGEKYKFIFCKVRKKYKKDMEDAFEELKTKMLLLGNNDYEEYCNKIIVLINSEEIENNA